MAFDAADNDSCVPVETKYPDLVDAAWVQTLFGASYAAVLIMGLAGNVVTGYCVLYLGISVGINNCFVLSLTCSNMLIAGLSLPFTALHIFSRDWLLGATLCKAMPLLQGAGIFVCSFTLAAIALDRYRVIRRKALAREATRVVRGYWIAVVALWIAAVALSLPYAVFVQGLFRFTGLCGLYCVEDWQSTAPKRAYGICTASVQFVLPTLILAYCYGRVRNVYSQSVQRRLRQPLTESGRLSLQERRHQISKITLLLFVAFIAPWLPYNFFNLLRDFAPLPVDYEAICFACVHLVAMTSTMWNPLIYFWLNSDFRRAVQKMESERRRSGSVSRRRDGSRFLQATTLNNEPNSAVCRSSSAINGSAVYRSTSGLDRSASPRLTTTDATELCTAVITTHHLSVAEPT